VGFEVCGTTISKDAPGTAAGRVPPGHFDGAEITLLVPAAWVARAKMTEWVSSKIFIAVEPKHPLTFPNNIDMSKLSPLIVLYAVAIPLALVLGYLVATPDLASYAVVGMVLFFLGLPLLLRWHHLMLIFFWNSAFEAFFLPGQPHFWLFMAALSLGIAGVNFVMGRQTFLRAPEITLPLFFLLAVILVTARYRGGLGIRLLGGGSYGGKNYIYVWGALIGYFALTAQRIPLAKTGRVVALFFLSGTTFVLSNLAYLLGPAFYIVYYLLPSAYVGTQVATDMGFNVVARYAGLAPAAIALFAFVLARWGIKGTLSIKNPWRLLLSLAAIVGALLSGFRSAAAILLVLFLVQFMVEGLWRTFWLPIIFGLGVLCLLPVMLYANRMPATVQRVLSVLPVDIDPNVRQEAENSTVWRFEMFHVVWQQVPQYFWIGKGYSIDPTELYLVSEAERMGILPDYEESILAGDYHDGLLSVIIPFGIFGLLGFVWLLLAGIRVLYCNYRYGDQKLRTINCFLLSYFLTQAVLFFAVFGAFSNALATLLGVLGLSVSLNGGVCRKAAVVRRAAEPPPLANPALA
jgi:O-antigen ligase